MSLPASMRQAEPKKMFNSFDEEKEEKQAKQVTTSSQTDGQPSSESKTNDEAQPLRKVATQPDVKRILRFEVHKAPVSTLDKPGGNGSAVPAPVSPRFNVIQVSEAVEQKPTSTIEAAGTSQGSAIDSLASNKDEPLSNKASGRGSISIQIEDDLLPELRPVTFKI